MLFLDESGTHGGSPCLIVGGLAVHEDDARHLQQKLESFLHRKIAGPPLLRNALEFELHATDIKNGNDEWKGIPGRDRFDVLHGTYSTILNYSVRWANFPMVLFGAVVDTRKVPDRRDREKLAYELVLNKFDAMLGRINRVHGARQRGLVIHDQRVVHGGRRVWTEERAIQEWTKDWREAADRVGRIGLRNFADIPLFADSRSSRLIQAADFVSYALWRSYGVGKSDYLDMLVPRFDAVSEEMHGLIHISRDYASATCTCPPCRNRLERGLNPGTI